jgi:site-specific recombinase XerD
MGRLIDTGVTQMYNFQAVMLKGSEMETRLSSEEYRGPRTWFERALNDAKIEEFRWHDLRHTAARHLRRKGAKLEDIAEFLVTRA